MVTSSLITHSSIQGVYSVKLTGTRNSSNSGNSGAFNRLSRHCISKPLLVSDVFGDQLILKKPFQSCSSFSFGGSSKRRNGNFPVCAVLTSAPPIPVQSFPLEDGNQLEVKTFGSTSDSRRRIELQVSNGDLVNAPLILHWGATSSQSSGWTLPGWRPDGTKNYKNRALQSPFIKNDNSLFLCIEIADPNLDGIEFTLKNEANNRWYKFNNGNFRIAIPELTKVDGKVKQNVSDISIPEELVQIQAYLRWERNGKQNYSKEKEKEEYELGRLELQDEVASGLSLADLRARLKGDPAPSNQIKVDQAVNNNVNVKSNENKNAVDVNRVTPAQPSVPDDLIAVQAYIRWERNGKQNYSSEKQKEEFEEARKDLQREVLSGKSIESIRKQLTSNTDKKEAPSAPPKQYSKTNINRNKWDADSMINKFEKEKVEGVKKVDVAEREPSALELGAQIMEGVDNNFIVFKNIFSVGDSKLLVLVTNPLGEPKVRFATDMKEEVSIHWGVSSGNGKTWITPPSDFCSVEFDTACESIFSRGFAGDPSLQSLELNFEGADIKESKGISFVLKSSGNWYKLHGSDFFIPLFAQTSKTTLKDAEKLGELCKPISDEIIRQESEAERSLMHRFNVGADILSRAQSYGELGLSAMLVWFRFMATRQLVWNKNYNVKPREISAAQDRLTDILQNIYASKPSVREFVRMVMMCVGRGGEGDVGQRIRDEILVIQRANDCKGGMMEEWHQKLHNNTSPDDVVICQALLDYISSDFSIDVYWKTLNSNGVSRERLKSYDRPIVSEPKFRHDQKDGLIRDLNHYMKTLKAVHSGADLESAIAKCMGYKQGANDFMKSIEIHPINGLSSNLPKILQFVLEHIEDRATIPLLEGLLEARRELRPSIIRNNDRLKDLIFLDLSLDSSVRTVVERGLDNLADASAQDLIYIVSLIVENLCLSIDNNEELVYCYKDWNRVLDSCSRREETWALKAKSVMDRTRLFLADKSEHYQKVLQPTAQYIGSSLNVDQWAVELFTEEMIRSGSAASLSILLNRLDPVLRKAADMGSWQIISPAEVKGFVYVVSELGSIQEEVFDRPTVIIANRVRGEEEIPSGAIALLTTDMPDILSHVSVRARNEKICFATCFDENIFSDLKSCNGNAIMLKPTSSDLEYTKINENEIFVSDKDEEIPRNIQISKKVFANKFAIISKDFNPDLVGAKSRNISGLRGKLPPWIHLPQSVAIPFGSFEAILNNPINKDVSSQILDLKQQLKGENFSLLQKIREKVLDLQSPPAFIDELSSAMRQSGMPFPGDQGEERWNKAWRAIKKVWASKWNERAYFSTRKAGINHDDLCMSVLVQEIIQADYAFVIHTTNPSNDNESEIYAEVVRGLGEVLVGAFPGRALSFTCEKSNLNSPKVNGFPSKRVALFIDPSIIFRSDSNGEDLEGYAGAGLYDSVAMDAEYERPVDYSSLPLLVDLNFQKSILNKIALAGYEIEQLLGCPQDIEGVIKDGELYVVQTRPQM